jgi:hypothetical protein
LAEVRILRIAVRYDPRIDLWQGLAGPAPLRGSSHDRNDTIYKKAIAGFGIPPHKSCLLAGCHDLDTSRLTRRRLHRATRDQVNEKHIEDDAISAHLYLPCISPKRAVTRKPCPASKTARCTNAPFKRKPQSSNKIGSF